MRVTNLDGTPPRANRSRGAVVSAQPQPPWIISRRRTCAAPPLPPRGTGSAALGASTFARPASRPAPAGRWSATCLGLCSATALLMAVVRLSFARNVPIRQRPIAPHGCPPPSRPPCHRSPDEVAPPAAPGLATEAASPCGPPRACPERAGPPSQVRCWPAGQPAGQLTT